MNCSIQNTSSTLLFALSCAVNVACAAPEQRHWALEQYASKEKVGISAYSEGLIDGRHYLALIASSPEGANSSAIHFFLRDRGRHRVIARIELPIDFAANYRIEIRNNSFFIRRSVAHQGSHDARYQFKIVDKKFRLVGTERQSMQLGCYAGEDNMSTCTNHEVWSGTSYNFLKSSAICWRETIDHQDKLRIKEAADRFEQMSHPKGGIRSEVHYAKVKMPSLEVFNFSDFSLPRGCYFDQKNKRHAG